VVEQTLPHVPQFVTLVIEVSQPLAGLPSQSEYPVLHVGTQVPDGQVCDPLEFVQVLPQAPQLEVLSIDVSQPSLGSPLQSA
jgi:hypothetical protein